MAKMWEEQCWAFRRSPNPKKMLMKGAKVAENEVRYEREEASDKKNTKSPR